MHPSASNSRACCAPRTAVAQAALLLLLLLCSAAAHAQTTTGPSSTAEVTLAPVTVSSGAEQENPTAPVTGFVAQRALSATKTDTPLIETPQAISVVTRDQMEAQGVQTLRQVTAYTAGAVSNYFDSRVDSFAARGGTVSQYQDGLLRTYGTYNTSRPDPYTLERVEFLRGPTTAWSPWAATAARRWTMWTTTAWCLRHRSPAPSPPRRLPWPPPWWPTTRATGAWPSTW